MSMKKVSLKDVEREENAARIEAKSDDPKTFPPSGEKGWGNPEFPPSGEKGWGN